MIGAQVEVNSVAFEASMQRLRSAVRSGLIDPAFGTLTVQGRLLAERCQQFTPPRNVGQGKAAVARDIMAVYFPLSHTTFTDKGLRRIVRKDDRQAWNKVSPNFPNGHGLKDTQAIGFSADLHKRRRMSRGRGPRRRYGNIGFVTLGPEGREARKFLKQKQKLVGWARAGWNAGIVGLGGVVKTSWVSRHGLARGRLFDGRTSADPYIRVLNDTGWARYGSMGEGIRIMRNAINARARDMESYVNRMMRLAAQKAGVAA